MRIIQDLVGTFRKEMSSLVEKVDASGITPQSFSGFLQGLRAMLNQLGRDALLAMLAQKDEAADIIEREGRALRFKQVSRKDWLTPFGGIAVPRRFFQADRGGDGIAPLDVRCGMVDRYLTADLEEMVAFASG